MATPEGGEIKGTQLNPYLSLDASQQAINALEETAYQLGTVLENPESWKWAVLALHNAVQGYMVLALTGSTNWGALRDTDVSAKVQAESEYRKAMAAGDQNAANQFNTMMLFGESELAPFLTLYNRIKSNDWWMLKYTSSKSFKPRPYDDLCIKNLDSIRNELVNFVPMSRGFLLTEFPAMTETGLFVIEFLALSSGNIQWYAEGEFSRFERALSRARASLVLINVAYDGLPLPAEGLCGAPPK